MRPVLHRQVSEICPVSRPEERNQIYAHNPAHLLGLVTSTLVGKIVASGFISMLPLVELRAGIPIAVGLGLEPRIAILTCIVANILPIPFIILFIRKIFAVVRKWSATFEKLISKVEAKAYKHQDMIDKYAAMGLFILTAIPLPGTGAWTASLLATLMDMRLSRAFFPIALGALAPSWQFCPMA